LRSVGYAETRQQRVASALLCRRNSTLAQHEAAQMAFRRIGGVSHVEWLVVASGSAQTAGFLIAR
jgi:hypothetical protein